MFESIFTSTTDNAISISQSITGILTAVVIGLVIAFVYTLVSKRDGYNKSFIIGLALLPAIVAAVILLVGSNVARAFSMAGAFALVRFRSAPGSAKDISVVFFAMASGLACGLGFVTFAVCFTVIILAVLIVLSLTGFGSRGENRKQLRITIPENLNYMAVFDDIFAKYLSENELRKVKTTNMGTMFELTYECRMKDESEQKQFIDELRVRMVILILLWVRCRIQMAETLINYITAYGDKITVRTNTCRLGSFLHFFYNLFYVRHLYNSHIYYIINNIRKGVVDMVDNNTQFFKTQPEKTISVEGILEQVYLALKEKGYNPVNQIVGYIMSGDPTYITSHNNARSLIMKAERDELVEEVVRYFIEGKGL